MPSVYALLTAIDKYPNPRHVLDGCVNDLRHFQTYLETHCENTGLTLNVQVLTDEQVTRDALIAGFTHFQAAQAGDQCLFFYGGHGSRSKAPEAFWHLESDHQLDSLVCWDSRSEGGRDLMDKELSWLIWQAVKDKDIPFVSITDCCHSGILRDPEKKLVRKRDIKKVGSESTLEQYLGYTDYHKSARGELSPPRGRRIHLGAARDVETAKEASIGGIPRGAFTYCLVETLYESGSFLSYESLLGQVNLRVRRMVSEQSPQLESTEPEDKKLGFLSLIEASERAPYAIIRDKNDPHTWWLNAGAIHGISVGEPGNRTLLTLLEDQHVVEVTAVEPALSKVKGMDNYDPLRTYAAVMSRRAIPPYTLGIAPGSDPVGIAVVEAQLQKTKANLFNLTRDKPGDFLLHAEDGALFLSRPHEYAPLFKRVPGYDEAAAIYFLQKLESVAAWRQVLDLHNPDTRIRDEEITLDLQRVTEAGNDHNDAPSEQVDWRVRPVQFPYLPKDGQWHQPGFKLKIKNTGYRTLWVSLLFLGDDFGISNVLLPKQALKPGEEASATDVVNGYPYFVIPLRLAQQHLPNGIHAIEECLKVMISTEEFNTDLFNQKGLPPDEGQPLQPMRDVGRIKEVETKDWRTLEIWVRIEKDAPR